MTREKVFKNYNELISLLQSRGVDLSTSQLRGTAKKDLQHIGYYGLINGYKSLFLVCGPDGQPVFPETYKSGTTVDEIYHLYRFDDRLRSLFFKNILQIEANIKSLTAYTFPEHHGHKNYLVYDNFDTFQGSSIQNITALFSDIQKQIANRVSDPSISHYLTVYGYIPLWVLNNILTFGQVSKFYSLMKQPERQEIAKVFCVQENELKNFLTYLTSIRNVCAHNNRLYCFRTKRPLLDLQLHKDLGIPRGRNGEYKYGKRDLFAALLILKIMLSRNEFNTLIKQIRRALYTLKSHLVVLNEEDILKSMGFPSNWENMLKSV